MRVPVLPVPSATLARLPGILTLIHGRGEQYCTVVFVFLLASLSSYCFGNGQWDNSASRPLDDAYSSSLLYTGNSACKQITQYGGMCDAGQPLETASPCVPMGGARGISAQRQIQQRLVCGARLGFRQLCENDHYFLLIVSYLRHLLPFVLASICNSDRCGRQTFRN